MSSRKVTSTRHFRGANAIAAASLLLALVVDEMAEDKDSPTYLDRLRQVQMQLDQGLSDMRYEWDDLSKCITDTSMMEDVGYD